MEGIKPNLRFFISKLPSLVTVRLAADNYLLWKYQTTNVFQAHGYFGYIDGSLPCPPSEVNNGKHNTAYDDWKITDRHLSTCLQSTITVGVLPALIGLTTCHEIWEVLEQRYASLSATHVHQLRTELALTKMGNNSAALYLDKLKMLADKLSMIDSSLTASEFVHKALVGLPKKYGPFRTAILARTPPVTLDEFYSLLLAEEANLSYDSEEEDAAPPNPASALNVQTPNANHGRGRNNPIWFTRGSWRGRGGFRGRGRGGYSQGGRATTPLHPHPCIHCGWRNHLSHQCFFKPEGPSDSTAFHAGFGSYSNLDNNWYVDSGATDHITHNMQNLMNPQPSSSSNATVTVRNGQ